MIKRTKRSRYAMKRTAKMESKNSKPAVACVISPTKKGLLKRMLVTSRKKVQLGEAHPHKVSPC